MPKPAAWNRPHELEDHAGVVGQATAYLPALIRVIAMKRNKAADRFRRKCRPRVLDRHPPTLRRERVGIAAHTQIAMTVDKNWLPEARDESGIWHGWRHGKRISLKAAVRK